MGKSKINREINVYIERLKRTVKPDKVILFGSFARNEASKWSDIDMLVISNFKNIPEKKRDYILYDLSEGLIKNHDFHVYGITPEEFESAKPWTIFEEIKKEGIILYVKN